MTDSCSNQSSPCAPDLLAHSCPQIPPPLFIVCSVWPVCPPLPQVTSEATQPHHTAAPRRCCCLPSDKHFTSDGVMRWLAKKRALPSTSSSAVGVGFGVAAALLATAVGVRFDLASFSLLVDRANEVLLLFNGVSPRPGNSMLLERAASESANSCRSIRFECIIRAIWNSMSMWGVPERCSSSLYGERLEIPRVRSLP